MVSQRPSPPPHHHPRGAQIAGRRYCTAPANHRETGVGHSEQPCAPARRVVEWLCALEVSDLGYSTNTTAHSSDTRHNNQTEGRTMVVSSHAEMLRLIPHQIGFRRPAQAAHFPHQALHQHEHQLELTPLRLTSSSSGASNTQNNENAQRTL
jgi:hypothetical protein